ncbi:hypothetical protein RvVAR0630_pl08960 (plasmid) [Agrobacterium vitis]|uniref:antitoxin VbhA family protein n=1 Tax=Agrobacterium vitis TaxID=373 RepID=UPI0008DBFE49|nr:antitoxin VbhA family protein [Agrobacterium vitis]MUO87154.1 hypothetical protein [Agrobacterium vitis]BCH62754.1 hypothetical protein RvVAR0630_pl08960 [Agrobacterium vitis]
MEIALQQVGPDRSPEAIKRRRSAADQARAMNIRQGYVHDAFLEECTEKYVQGEISREDYRDTIRRPANL